MGAFRMAEVITLLTEETPLQKLDTTPASHPCILLQEDPYRNKENSTQ